MPQPSWDTPAHLFGLPYTNWKRKTGCEMRGTLAECIERWLGLPPEQQQNCTLTNDAAPGQWGPASIRAYVAAHGVPPQLPRITAEELAKITAKPQLAPRLASEPWYSDSCPHTGQRRRDG
jgi:hypothetical protein